VNADGTVSWRQLATEAGQRLAAEGFESAEIEARRIVEEASGTEGSHYWLGLDDLVTVGGMARFDRMLERRLTGEPLQYVLGRWGFRTLDLMVDRRVLIPRPETEVVVEHALERLDQLDRPAATVVDLGTGSGAIALSIATEREDVEVWAVDRSADAVAVARANLGGLGRNATRVRIVEGSWFDPLPEDLRGRVDLVVSNPPYVAPADPLPAEVADWEPVEALIPGPTGLEALEVICAEAPGWLAPGGWLVVEIGETQGRAAHGLAHRAGLVDIEVRPDLTGRPRALLARRRHH
jgi:release factor glutamine methyltransferase